MNLRESIIAICFALAATPAAAQLYLPQGVSVPAQSVIGNTKNMASDAVAVPFTQLKASLGVPAAQSCTASNWVNSFSSLGIFGCLQPGISDITGLPSALAALLPLSGGTMSGNVAMGGNNISGIGTVTATTYSGLPIGSSSTAGVVKVDGTTITASAGTISAKNGWTLLNTLTASSSSSLSDTTSFTSTYTEYEIVFKNVVAATASVTGQLAVHSGGSFQTSGYLTSSFGVATGPTAFFDGGTTFIALSHAASTSSGGSGLNGKLQVSSPSATSIHGWTGLMTYPISGGSGTIVVGGFWNTAAAIDGFSFNFSSGNITSGTIEVYGRL
jgi:hypothetical protein